MSAIPWSATRELKLRQWITLLWAGVWFALLGGLLCAILAHDFRIAWLNALAGMSWGIGFFLLYKLNEARAELGEEMCRLPNGQFYEGSGMLANKPRGTANLTPYIHHIPNGYAFSCSGCGRTHLWADAQWIPNYDPEQFGPGDLPQAVDPGGGRYVILCPCGLGHYKLKA